MNIDELTRQFGGNGISFEDYHGFPAIRIKNQFSSALISLYGGHVIEFLLPGHEPVLWMSKASKFENGAAIRGGVPVCFPWFGAAPEGKSGSHGFVRNTMWDIDACGITPDGGNFASLIFKCREFELYYTVTAARELTLSLEIYNSGADVLEFSGALHTYFNISDTENVYVENLDGLFFMDSVTGDQGVQYGSLVIDREIDRVFRGCGSTRIVDNGFKRTIIVDKYGSDSTVIWNPWIEKSKRMPDFGDEEYHSMLCIEAAKVPKIGDKGLLTEGQLCELRQVIRVVRKDD